MARRDEEKKRRRQKRLQKQQSKQTRRLGDIAQAPPGMEKFLTTLADTLSIPEPASWPGASDASLARPDRVKFELAEFAIKRSPSGAKFRQLEDGLRKGHIGFLPEIDHCPWHRRLWPFP